MYLSTYECKQIWWISIRVVSTGLLGNIFNVNEVMGTVHFSIIFMAKLCSVLILSVSVSGSEKTSL